MFSFFKVNFCRFATVFLATTTLFFGITLFGNTSVIAAESITRDVTNLNTVDAVDDGAYEAMKEGRQREQARRSAMATPNEEDEGIVEKLNLNEGLPRSTKKLVEQVAGDEPINNETRP